MPAIQDFDTFYEQAQEIYRANPLATRYCMKYRHTDGKLVLKVTDDVVVGDLMHAIMFKRPCSWGIRARGPGDR